MGQDFDPSAFVNLEDIEEGGAGEDFDAEVEELEGTEGANTDENLGASLARLLHLSPKSNYVTRR